ncbi:transcription-repair coupling factor [Acetohalobium arabaticum]|uniref:Transcription-repair-coupling factor n=1 Tax=Acetohalobium arabaticum (strain ATCC 49924 / DSM 5501 / Z-7288) TaxID=574087 RepID=D9QSV5_ACEAZ|nr:transcription-repair coupling factor [Acetohalobium arabaticum]ADL11643.1 transcription-repair coupling factor [Acetohalobium arabaticum DSM 5501]
MEAGLSDLLAKTEKIGNLKKNLTENLNTQLEVNLSVSQRAFIAANIYEQVSDKFLLLTYNWQRAAELYEELLRLLATEEIFLFPQLEVLPHESIEVDISVKVQRLTALEKLTTRDESIIIAPIQALLMKLPPADIFADYSFRIDFDSTVELKKISSQLINQGYCRVDMVENKGDFSIRGGIIDIYPLTRSNPVRIELFGDEVESIREFDLATQRSIKELNDVHIPPATEILLDSDSLQQGIAKLNKELKQNREVLIEDGKNKEAKELERKLETDLEQIEEGIQFPAIRQYLPAFYSGLSTLIDYFNEGSLVFDSPNRIQKRAVDLMDDHNGLRLSLLNQGSVLSSYAKNFASFEELLTETYDYSKLYLNKTQEIKSLRVDRKLEFNLKETPVFRGQINHFLDELKQLIEQQYRVIITLSTESKCKRLINSLQEEDLTAFYTEEITDKLQSGNIAVTTDALQKGFSLPDLKFILFTETDIFGQSQRKKKRKTKTYDQGAKISSFEELNVGDYVVHENHGIGKYLGVKTLEVQGHNQDYLLIKYADEDKLYVPTDQVNLIQKYVGKEGNKPKLYSLGSNDWARVKQRVKESVQEMAEELLDIYAEREVKDGYAFSEDTVWQQEFESDFPYEETPDQLKTIEEVKEDMESPQPMDRLLCGDVGYGKTEVAIRAAFKAVLDGKQVAMLVPTTILAQQHLNTFIDRFEDYPVKVGMLSRFKTAKEQKKIIEDLKQGIIDIIIGTHRILSTDIEFNDLGFLIVDEEQRFGVKHKERLKQIKKSIDVLTLTATPIPRTLHMSLVGVRDMSLIETPPQNRYPIRTYVREYSDDLIREAIRKEIDRGGQVYFVHNRVKNIDKVAAKIKKLLPKAEVVTAHGQMSEAKLEKIMLGFLDGEHDVLVCTTIIETGLDIPNVNTILINNADQLGLAQLYQLRGRVGRTNRVAYAYLLYQQDQVLSEVAEKRLQAIKEFTNLGSGFKIAMRDLEIRGAGNILGPKQHGHIEAIGFSLYCKLLEQAVNELKGEDDEEEAAEINIDLELDAYIPEDYIPDSKQKIEIYKKISGIMNLTEVEEVKAELRDRFGAIPQSVLNLVMISKIKVLALNLDVKSIESKDGLIMVNFNTADYLSGPQILKLSDQYSQQIGFKSAKEPVLKLETEESDVKILEILAEVLDYLIASQDLK